MNERIYLPSTVLTDDNGTFLFYDFTDEELAALGEQPKNGESQQQQLTLF